MAQAIELGSFHPVFAVVVSRLWSQEAPLRHAFSVLTFTFAQWRPSLQRSTSKLPVVNDRLWRAP